MHNKFVSNNGGERYCSNLWVFVFLGLVAFQLIAAGGEKAQ